MGKITNLMEWKERKELELMLKEIEEIKSCEKDYEIYLKHLRFNYFLDNDLLYNGWEPWIAIPLDKNYFIERKKVLSYIDWPEFKEIKSKFKDTNKPCIVFYVKNNDLKEDY